MTLRVYAQWHNFVVHFNLKNYYEAMLPILDLQNEKTGSFNFWSLYLAMSISVSMSTISEYFRRAVSKWKQADNTSYISFLIYKEKGCYKIRLCSYFSSNEYINKVFPKFIWGLIEGL